jgi:hypothetical protein
LRDGRKGNREEQRAGPHLRRRGGEANARRRVGRVAADEAEDLAGAARRREADERSSDLAAAAAAIVVAER